MLAKRLPKVFIFLVLTQIKMNKLKFNYAYSRYHSAANASTFSLQIDLDKY